MTKADGQYSRVHARLLILTVFIVSIVCGLASSARADVAERFAAQDVEPQSDPRDVADTNAPFALRKIADRLELPWAVAFLPDGRILVTERRGRLRVIQNEMLLTASIDGVPEVATGGHSGLLDVLVDPNFESNHRIFLSYMVGTREASRIRVSRARLENMELLDKQVLFESNPPIKGNDQIGGRLIMGPEGYLYLTIGERMQMQRAQDLFDDGGKVVRFKTDGSIPADNPFIGRTDARPEIYSYGHRNSQGLIFNPLDKRIWSVEQGPKGGDELNVIKAGANYGWPLVTFGTNYDDTIISDKTSAPGLESPIHHWVPSLSTASLVLYNGNVMPPEWNGSLLIGTLVGECLVRLEMRDGAVVKEERYLHHSIGRIRDVAVGPSGHIYLLTDSSEARLYRVEPLPDEIANRRPQ